MRLSLVLIARVVTLASVCLALVAGCGDSHGPAADAGTDAPDAYVAVDAWTPPDAWSFAIGPHGPGTVVPDQGGARLTHPQIVTITFADEPNRDVLEADASWLVSSSWITTVGAEYGIGTGAVLANVHRTEAAPDHITTSEIEALLTAAVADGSLPRAADGTFTNVLYVIYFPQHTTIDDPSLGQSCMGYGGYHFEITTTGGETFSYAVIPSCPGFIPSLSALEFEEEAFAHEVIEAATDARPMTRPAYEFSQTGSVFSPWLFLGPELADLCALHVSPNAYVRESGFVASRLWSNAAAMANDRDPCIPADTAHPYYTVSVTPEAATQVTAGSTVTFDLALWTTAPMADMQLYAAASGGTFTPGVSIDRTYANNGDHATLTVMIPPGTGSGYAVIYVEVVVSTEEYNAVPVVVWLP